MKDDYNGLCTGWTGPNGIANVPEPKGVNPKDLIGDTKPNIALVPTAAIIGMADCMGDGARKYGPFNWREKGKPVQVMTYISAAQRHLLAFTDGEDNARDSHKHHIAHAMAGLAVLYDAMQCGNMVDNRPIPGAAADLIEQFTREQLK